MRCDAEIPAVKPPELPKQGTWTPETPKIPPRAWSVSVLATGGFAGGLRGFMASSDRPGCSPGLNVELERAIADVQPAQWQPYYRSDGPLRVTDQFSYTMTLKIDDANYITSWLTDSVDKLPDDARRVYEALDRLGKECAKRRAG